MQFQLNSKKLVAILSLQILWFDLKQENSAQNFSLILQILSPSNPTIKSFLHLIICNCTAVKVEWRSESDWFGLLIQFISDRRESNSLQITSFNPDTLMPFKIFLLAAFIY